MPSIPKRTGGVLAVCALAAAAFTAVPERAAAQPAGEGPVTEHRVLKGDNLSLLAGYYYGNPRQWREIYRSNSGVIKDPRVLIPGTVLKVKSDPGAQWPEPYEEFISRVRR